MTGTDWALAALGGLIGVMLYRLVRRAVSAALDRKRTPGSDLPVRLTRVNRRRLIVLLAGAANTGLSDVWRLAGGSAGQAHVFLAKLERSGLVTSDRETPEPQDRPRRRFYRLTPEGRAVVMQALRLREGVRP